MIMYELGKESISYVHGTDNMFENLYMKEDVMFWAMEVVLAHGLEDGKGNLLEVVDIEDAINYLADADEYLREVEIIGGDIERIRNS